MNVYILGKNKDNKGSQLEELTCQILEHQGFSNIVRNSQQSGASEIDVRAVKINHIGVRDVPTPIICECKAHNRAINMDDWQKFIGKLYIERRKSKNAEQTIGLMISLSGANGCVQGSFMDDFIGDDKVQLIANDDLLNILSELYSIENLSIIKKSLTQKYPIQCWDIDIAYFEKKCYLIVSLDNSQYTLCKTSGELFKKCEVEDVIGLINDWTGFSSEKYVDVWTMEQTSLLLKTIESNLLTCLFTLGDITFDEAQNHIVYVPEKLPIPREQIKEAAMQSDYINVDETNDTLSLAETTEFIPFINHLYNIGIQAPLFSSQMFQDMISLELLNQIKLVQFGIDLDEQEQNNCLFLIKHSPSALLYAINADNFLHAYKEASTNEGIKKLMHNHFFRQLIKFFEEDFSNPMFSSLMHNNFSIADLYMQTQVTLKDNNNNEQNICFEQQLSLIPMKGMQQPMLISHIIDKKQ